MDYCELGRAGVNAAGKIVVQFYPPETENSMAYERRCHKDDPSVPFLCSCDDCSRAAARSWMGYMDRVMDGEISLDEAQRLADTDPEISR